MFKERMLQLKDSTIQLCIRVLEPNKCIHIQSNVLP